MPTVVFATRCLAAAAILAAAGVCVCLLTSWPMRRAGLLALPMLLAAMPSREPPASAIPPGPVRLQGVVADVVRAPLRGQLYVSFVDGPKLRLPLELEVVAGDQLSVLALAGFPAAPGWPPPLQAAAGTVELRPGTWGLRRGCALLRRSFERELLRLVPGEHGAMLATLVLGRATRPDIELTKAHRSTGLSHLLAVSGAHAAMLAFLLGLGSRGKRLGASRIQLWSVLAILTVYGLVAGAEPPVVRAVVAFLLAALASRTGRPFGLGSGLLAPALVTAAVEPESLTGPSFLLSYAAVIGLGVAARGRPPAGAAAWISNALRASFWATLLTTPLTLWFFGQVAPSTILLTPLCAPIVALLLLFSLIAASVAAVCPLLAEGIAPLLHGLSAVYATLVYAADALPCTPIPARVTPPAWLVSTVSVAAAAWIAWRPRRSSLIGGVLAVTATWFCPLDGPAAPSLQLFAVGHGQAALLTTPSELQVVIDCGSLQGGARAARAVTDSLTRRDVDLLVVTHGDADHHNGLTRLLETSRVARVVAPAVMAGTEVHELLRRHVDHVDLLGPGERLCLDELVVYAPRVPAAASVNDQSLWVRAAVGGAEVLLSGDAQELGVAAALADGFAAPADVLLLPHHGRANHNLPRLLARVRPRACIASASSADGDTSQGSVARRFGAEVWTTGRHGDLRFDGAVVSAAVSPPLLKQRAAPGQKR